MTIQSKFQISLQRIFNIIFYISYIFLCYPHSSRCDIQEEEEMISHNQDSLMVSVHFCIKKKRKIKSVFFFFHFAYYLSGEKTMLSSSGLSFGFDINF